VETSDLAQILLKLFDDSMVSLHLVLRRKRMDVAELWPGDGDHAAGAVQLHRATAEGDHAVGEAEILGGEVVDVAEHLRLGVMLVEDGVGEDLRGPGQFSGDGRLCGLSEVCERDGRLRRGRGKDIDQIDQVLGGNALIKGNTNTVAVDLAKVDVRGVGCSMDSLCAGDGTSDIKSEGVKECNVLGLVSKALHRRLEDLGEAMNLVGDTMKTVRSVVHSIHRRHIGEKSLGGADVAGCLLTTDMLLASCTIVRSCSITTDKRFTHSGEPTGRRVCLERRG